MIFLSNFVNQIFLMYSDHEKTFHQATLCYFYHLHTHTQKKKQSGGRSMCMFVYVFMHICTHVCEGQRLMSEIIFNNYFTLFIETRSLNLTQSS